MRETYLQHEAALSTYTDPGVQRRIVGSGDIVG